MFFRKFANTRWGEHLRFIQPTLWERNTNSSSRGFRRDDDSVFFQTVALPKPASTASVFEIHNYLIEKNPRTLRNFRKCLADGKILSDGKFLSEGAGGGRIDVSSFGFCSEQEVKLRKNKSLGEDGKEDNTEDNTRKEGKGEDGKEDTKVVSG